MLGFATYDRCLANPWTARVTVTRRSLWLSRTRILFQAQWMAARTEQLASPRRCGASSSVVRVYRRTRRAHFPI